jgi:hypothetical protein
MIGDDEFYCKALLLIIGSKSSKNVTISEYAWTRKQVLGDFQSNEYRRAESFARLSRPPPDELLHINHFLLHTL